MDTEELLHVKDLRVQRYGRDDLIKIVDGINLRIDKGETVGLVGETGAGKSVSALAILGILQPIGKGKPQWKIDGEAWFKGKDLLKLPVEEMRKIRGVEISLITQNPIASLHPIDIIGFQTGEAVEAHQEVESRQIREMVVNYLGKVEIPDSKARYHHFRDQFSGGEGQRILLAMALIRNPSLLIADEPTSALDVTVQRQILQLLKAMKKRFSLAMLLITHNLAVVAEMSDYVYVMYAGKILEQAGVRTIFKEPVHPYTQGLLSAVPSIQTKKGFFEFGGIPGEPPNPLHPISGCKFHPRCRHAEPACRHKIPELVEVGSNHFVACLRSGEIPEYGNRD